MNRIIKKLVSAITENPKKVFLIDSLGAMSTAFILFVIIRQLNEYFGMPKTVLAYLAILAIFLCIYSTACFLFLKRRWTPFIRLIAVANLLYCTLTIGLLIKYYSLLTILGITYFIIEIAIISTLSSLELTVARENKKKNS